ncbi:MAG: hypothetical protein ACRC5M_02900 [Anaeroplasmataceae bacterium]
MLKVIDGDITKVHNGFIIHQVNNKGIMGGGVALTIKSTFPTHFKDYMYTKTNRGLNLGELIVSRIDDDLHVVGLIGQNGLRSVWNKCPTSYEAFFNGLCKIKELKDKYPNKDFYMPYRIACFRGGGDWETISKMIEHVCPFIILINYNGTKNF